MLPLLPFCIAVAEFITANAPTIITAITVSLASAAYPPEKMCPEGVSCGVVYVDPSLSLTAKAFSNASIGTEESASLLKQLADASTEGERIKGGVTILGCFPEYTDLGKLEGMTYFNMEKEVFETLQQAGDDSIWVVNKQFLDDNIAAANKFVVTLGEGKTMGKWLEREIQYLLEHGYRLVNGIDIKK